MHSNIFHDPNKTEVLTRKDSVKSVVSRRGSEKTIPTVFPKTPKAQPKIEKYKTASQYDWQTLNTEIAFNQTAKKANQYKLFN